MKANFQSDNQSSSLSMMWIMITVYVGKTANIKWYSGTVLQILQKKRQVLWVKKFTDWKETMSCISVQVDFSGKYHFV